MTLHFARSGAEKVGIGAGSVVGLVGLVGLVLWPTVRSGAVRPRRAAGAGPAVGCRLRSEARETSPVRGLRRGPRTRRYHDRPAFPAVRSLEAPHRGRLARHHLQGVRRPRHLSRTRSTKSVAKKIGNAFARFTARVDGRRRPRHAAVVGPARARPSSRAPRSPGADVVDVGLASTDLVYFASGPLDAPGRDVHGQPQPGPVQRDQAVPGVGGADRRGDAGWSRSRRRSPPGLVERAEEARPGRATRDLLDEFAHHVRSFVDVDALRPLRVVADTANGMGGLVVPDGVRGPAVRARGAVRRARRHVPEPPGRPDPAREPRRRSRRPCSTPARTSVSRSTATPTACSSSTTRAQPVSGFDHDRDRRQGDARQPVRRRDGRPQPDLLEGRPRGDPGDAAATPVRTPGRPLVHQAGDGRDRRGLRRRALGALLLPRQLAGRLRDHRRDGGPRAAEPARASRSRSCASRSSATPRRARSTPRSPTRRR